MVMICQQCGDRGFANAFIYCVECLSYAIHRYCLEILPKTVHEFVPWVCEDCKPKVPNQSTFPNHDSIRSPGKDFASSIHGEEIHSRKKLKKSRGTASLVDGVEIDSCQEASIEQDLRRIPWEDSPLKVNLKKRKKRDSACLVDGTKKGSGRKVITEPDHEHVPLAGSPMKQDSEKQKKKGNNASLLNGTEGFSCDEVIGEPDREFVTLPDAPLKVNLKKRNKERDFSSLVDGAEEDSCQKWSTELDQECVPLAELCLKAKFKNKKKRRPDCWVAGTEEDNCHGGVTKEPDRQHTPLADSPLKLKLKKKTKEKDTALDVKENSSCLGDATEPDRLHAPLADSPVKVKLKKRKKEKRTALDVKENSNCPGAATGPENACAPLADSSLKVNLKWQRDVAHTEARASELKCQSIPSQQPNGIYRKHDLAEHAELAGCCSPLKRKFKIMESDSSCSVSGTEDKKLQSSPNDSPHESCTKIELKKKDVACSADVRKCQFDSSQQPLEADKKLDIADHAKLVSYGCPSLKLELDKKMKKDNKHGASKTEDKRHQSRFHQQPPMIHKKQDIDGDKHLNIEKERQPMIGQGSEPGHEVQFTKISQQDVHGQAQPVIDPIWMGSFDIVNKDYETFEGFVGHVSSRVGLKVCEEASLLPSLLCLEMLPKSDLWPKSFQEYKPSDENIALYFFPADSKHERVFDHLVEDMMNQELAMRAVVTNAELLIFSSTELPRVFWRFHGKYYLWGVFKGKRVDPSPPLNNRLVLPKGSNGSAQRTNPLNEVVSGPRNLTKTKILDAQSPPSPLRNIG